MIHLTPKGYDPFDNLLKKGDRFLKINHYFSVFKYFVSHWNGLEFLVWVEKSIQAPSE